jgi:hypothetical protein
MHALYALARAWSGDLRGAADGHAAARRRCAELSFPMGPFTDAYIVLVRSLACAHLGEVTEARACVTEAQAIAEERGFDAWLFWASILRTTFEAFVADDDLLPGILGQAALSADMLHAMGVRIFSASMRSFLGVVALGASDPALARSLADAALDLAEETGTGMSIAEALRVQALTGPADEVEAALVAALDHAEARGSVISAVRIATDLVQLGGSAHRARLEASLAQVVSDTEPGAPVLADARAVLSTR